MNKPLKWSLVKNFPFIEVSMNKKKEFQLKLVTGKKKSAVSTVRLLQTLVWERLAFPRKER